MTQSVQDDDIRPVRADRRRWGGVRSSWRKYYVTAEGRRDLWAESKVNNDDMVTHFFGARLKRRSPLPLNM